MVENIAATGYQLANKEAAELETNAGDTHLTCNLDG